MGGSPFNAKGRALCHNHAFAYVATVPMLLHKLLDPFHFGLGFPRMLPQSTLGHSTGCFILRIRKVRPLLQGTHISFD